MSVTVAADGRTLAVVPKEVVTKRGITMIGVTRRVESIELLCATIQDRLRADGPFNVQLILDDDGRPFVFEINPRFSTTVGLTMAAGVNEPDVVFRNAVRGEEVKIDGYDRLVCMRYWNEVYVPYALYEKASRDGRIEKGSFVPDYF